MMDPKSMDSGVNPRRHRGLKATLLAGAATLALAFPVAALAQGWHGHAGGGHAAGGHGMVHASVGHASGGWHHGGGWHGGGWHGGGWHGGGWHGGGWGWGYGGGGWPGYAYGYDYPYYYTPPASYAANWYCPNPAGYYPYVTQCYAPWQPAG